MISTRASTRTHRSVRLGLSFGRHFSRSDALEFRKHAEAFRPDVIVPEMLYPKNGSLRCLNYEANEQMRVIRGSDSREIELIRRLSDSNPYHNELARVVIDLSQAILYIEEYTPFSLRRYRRDIEVFSKLFDRRAIQALKSGDVGYVLEKFERYFRAVSSFYYYRNLFITEQLSKAGELIPLHLPDFSHEGELRVLARFGQAHLQVADLLEQSGVSFDFFNSTPPRYYTQMHIALSKDPSQPITDDVLLRTMFSFIHSGFGLMESHEKDVETEAVVFERIGGSRGFLVIIIDSAERTSISPFRSPNDTFLSELKSRISNV
ncbi:MAG: hypothetical protein PHU63_03210 [Candidatus ainarchaeum sp.]|nr:hypothetical protein [Candidatus ainarchaeum sp.]